MDTTAIDLKIEECKASMEAAEQELINERGRLKKLIEEKANLIGQEYSQFIGKHVYVNANTPNKAHGVFAGIEPPDITGIIDDVFYPKMFYVKKDGIASKNKIGQLWLPVVDKNFTIEIYDPNKDY